MELVHDFTVPVPAEQAFDLLTDVAKVGPCLPGAVITAVDGDTFQGGMRIKLGPIAMTFTGDGALVEKDRAQGRAVIVARGRDAKGNGGAQARVAATLDDRGAETAVRVVTDLDITGKAAQFGAGVVRDVSNRMLAQFADNLAALIRGGAVTPAAPGATGSSPSAPAPAPAPEAGSSARAGAAVPAGAAGGDGLDAVGLLLGSGTARAVLRPVAGVLVGLTIGYLYGKNRVLERVLRDV
ncbi:MAG TPA: SRPBCC family protein [Acidimicrobiales bacterium]|nr:SRPBCC family protein [Acidimicrobiales bacterium]